MRYIFHHVTGGLEMFSGGEGFLSLWFTLVKIFFIHIVLGHSFNYIIILNYGKILITFLFKKGIAILRGGKLPLTKVTGSIFTLYCRCPAVRVL